MILRLGHFPKHTFDDDYAEYVGLHFLALTLMYQYRINIRQSIIVVSRECERVPVCVNRLYLLPTILGFSLKDVHLRVEGVVPPF